MMVCFIHLSIYFFIIFSYGKNETPFSSIGLFWDKELTVLEASCQIDDILVYHAYKYFDFHQDDLKSCYKFQPGEKQTLKT